MTSSYEEAFFAFAKAEMTQDKAHDINHVLRVVKSAKKLCEGERANLNVVLPAAYLHDCFSFPKNHPDRKKSSKIAADKAIEFLAGIGYPSTHLDDIHHAITTHSFSANIKPRTLEAKIVQDADRLDALGAIGVTRCLQVSTALGRALYQNDDPFCEHRSANDSVYTIDHFYAKLLKLPESMNTESAKKEAYQRCEFMKLYLNQLAFEL